MTVSLHIVYNIIKMKSQKQCVKQFFSKGDDV